MRNNHLAEREKVEKKRKILPGKTKKHVTYFAWKYEISEAKRYGSSKYPQYRLKREKVWDWKTKHKYYFRKVKKFTLYFYETSLQTGSSIGWNTKRNKIYS